MEPTPKAIWRPSAVTIWSLVLGLAVLAAIAFLAGYIPLTKRNALLRSEAAETLDTRPQSKRPSGEALRPSHGA